MESFQWKFQFKQFVTLSYNFVLNRRTSERAVQTSLFSRKPVRERLWRFSNFFLQILSDFRINSVQLRFLKPFLKVFSKEILPKCLISSDFELNCDNLNEMLISRTWNRFSKDSSARFQVKVILLRPQHNQQVRGECSNHLLILDEKHSKAFLNFWNHRKSNHLISNQNIWES